MQIFGRFLILLLVFWLWLSLTRTYYVCQLKSHCNHTALSSDSIILSKIPKTLSVEADCIKILQNYPEFHFEKASDTAHLFEIHNEFLNQLSVMLKSQPNSRLLLIGRYKSQEDALLANKRVDNIIKKLVNEFSFSENAILHTLEIKTDSTEFGFLGFKLLGFVPASELLIAREDSLFKQNFKDSLGRISYNDILAAFDPSVKKINISDALNDYGARLKSFLSENPKRVIQVIGHCDTQISEKEADALSLHYAEAMATHLKSLGIKQQIQTIALGKKKAMYNELLPDQTVDVLAVSKNRRVEIIIKEISTSKTKPQKR